MKKLCLFLSMVMLLIMGSVTTAFADAASYDMEEAGYYVYVATPDGGLNMRYGPGTDYGKVMKGRIPDGVKLYIGYVSGNWGYTSYNGYEGWVALKQTSKNPPAPPATKKPQPVATPKPTVVPTPVPPTPTVAVTQAPQESIAPVVSQTPENTQPVVTATPEHNEEEDEKAVKAAMTNQILLIAIIVLFVIVIALLLVIIINLKTKR